MRDFSFEIVDWLRTQGADTVVVACNTASAAALYQLREAYPDLPIVGMEPAVKPAAALTGTGVIGVFATAATFQGELFDTVVSRWGSGTDVVALACPEWVEVVEAGRLDGPDIEDVVRGPVMAALDAGADTLVLGCTHFSFLTPVIARIATDAVAVIDPAPAVAAQTRRVVADSTGSGRVTMATSGDIDRFAELVSALGGWEDIRLVAFP